MTPSPTQAARVADTALKAAAAAPSNGTLLRQIFALAAPTTALSMLQVIAQLTETWLAARQGTATLAGWAVMLPFVLLMAMMSTGAMGGGVVSAVARALGAKKREEAAALVQHALMIATGFGLMFAIGVSLIARPLITAVAGADAAVQGAPFAYWVFAVGAVPAWWSNTLASVLRGGGRHGLAARVLAISSIAMPPLAWALAEPAGLGLAGVGLAFALTNIAAALALAAAVKRGDAGFVPHLALAPSWALFKRILAVGAVASALATVANLATIGVTAQLRHFGPATVAAYGIAARLEFLIIPIAFGIGAALTALVGRYVGAGDWPTARRIAWLGGSVSFAFTGVIGVVVAMWPLPFARLFTNDMAVATIAAQALQFTGYAFGAFGLGMSMYFASLGAGKLLWPTIAGLSRLGIAVLGGWWLAEGWGLGAQGNFIAVAAAITAYGVAAAAGVRPGVWRAKTLGSGL